MEQLTKNQAVATSQEAVQNQNEPQLRDENAHNDKSVHGVLNPTYQAGLRRDAVQPDIEAERKKRDEIEAGKSYCSRRFGGATCDDKSAQIYARFDKNDWRIQPAEFYRFHDAEVNTLVNAANQVVSVGADIAFDADPKFFACLVRFESSSVPTTLPTAYDVYPLNGRHDGGYYTVKDCVTIDVLPRTPGNNVYVGFMVWSNFTATKCRGLVSLNQVTKEIICLQPLKCGDLCLVLLLAVLLLLLLVAPCLNCLDAVKKPPPVAFKVMCLLPITIL